MTSLYTVICDVEIGHSIGLGQNKSVGVTNQRVSIINIGGIGIFGSGYKRSSRSFDAKGIGDLVTTRNRPELERIRI